MALVVVPGGKTMSVKKRQVLLNSILNTNAQLFSCVLPKALAWRKLVHSLFLIVLLLEGEMISKLSIY